MTSPRGNSSSQQLKDITHNIYIHHKMHVIIVIKHVAKVTSENTQRVQFHIYHTTNLFDQTNGRFTVNASELAQISLVRQEFECAVPNKAETGRMNKFEDNRMPGL